MKRHKPKKHKQPLNAIREMCKECMGGSDNPGYLKLIAECPSVYCALYDFRFGKNPHHIKDLSEEQRKNKAAIIRVSILGDKLSDNLS